MFKKNIRGKKIDKYFPKPFPLYTTVNTQEQHLSLCYDQYDQEKDFKEVKNRLLIVRLRQ